MFSKLQEIRRGFRPTHIIQQAGRFIFSDAQCVLTHKLLLPTLRILSAGWVVHLHATWLKCTSGYNILIFILKSLPLFILYVKTWTTCPAELTHMLVVVLVQVPFCRPHQRHQHRGRWKKAPSCPHPTLLSTGNCLGLTRPPAQVLITV